MHKLFISFCLLLVKFDSPLAFCLYLSGQPSNFILRVALQVGVLDLKPAEFASEVRHHSSEFVDVIVSLEEVIDVLAELEARVGGGSRAVRLITVSGDVSAVATGLRCVGRYLAGAELLGLRYVHASSVFRRQLLASHIQRIEGIFLLYLLDLLFKLLIRFLSLLEVVFYILELYVVFEGLDFEVLFELLDMVGALLDLDLKLRGNLLRFVLKVFNFLFCKFILLLELKLEFSELGLQILDLFRFLHDLSVED